MTLSDCFSWLRDHKCDVLEMIDAELKRSMGEIRDAVIAEIRHDLDMWPGVEVDDGMSVVDYCDGFADDMEDFLESQASAIVNRAVIGSLRAVFGEDVPDDVAREAIDDLSDSSMASKFRDYRLAFDILGLADFTIGDVLHPGKNRPRDFSDFRFHGRDEFFDPPLNGLSAYPLIVEAYRRALRMVAGPGRTTWLRILAWIARPRRPKLFLMGRRP